MELKDVLEVYDAADSTADALVKMCDDGKINLFDLRHAMAPIKAMVKAVQGADQVVAELRDLDVSEIDKLIDRSALTASKFVAAGEALKKLKPA